MSDKLKVVITLDGEKGAIGVQAPDCDPVFRSFEGDLGQALSTVPSLVEEARQLWDSAPLYPKCDFPLPSQAKPAPAPQRVATAARPTDQHPMF